MKLIVYRDKEGNVINIGEWDFVCTTCEDGIETINNPLPDGTTSKIEDVVINADGSRTVV